MDSPDPFHINAKEFQVRTVDFIKLYPHNDTTKTSTNWTPTGMWALTLGSLVNKVSSVLLINQWNETKRFAQITAFRSYQCFSLLSLLLLLAKPNCYRLFYWTRFRQTAFLTLPKPWVFVLSFEFFPWVVEFFLEYFQKSPFPPSKIDNFCNISM